MRKYIKSKRPGAAVLAVLSAAVVLSFFFAAAEDTPVSISNVAISDSVQSGSSFRAEITVKNNTSEKIGSVWVSTDNTSSGTVTVTTRERVGIELDAGAEETVSFDFAAGGVFAATVYKITFTVACGQNTQTQTRRITVRPPPPEPAAPQSPRFEKVTELYPKTVITGTNARIGFRFSNVGGPAYGVSVAISHNIPAGVEAVKATVISVGTMLPGQVYDCSFEFKITDKAPAGMQVFTITINSDSGASFSNTVSIMFEKGETDADEKKENSPNIYIVETDIAESVKKGEKFGIKTVLENSGADSGSVKVTIVSPPGIANISPNIIQIDSLKQNARKEISFELIATESAEKNYNLFEILLEYDIDADDKSEKIRKSQYVGLNVSETEKENEEKNFSIEVTVPENTKANDDFEISVTVKNEGADEKNIYLKIEAPAGMANKSANNFFIAELKSGESAVYEATFMAAEELAGKYCLFCVSLYSKQPGGPDVVLTDRYAGVTVTGFELSLPKVVIESIYFPQNVNIGETFDVEVLLANTGEDEAGEVILTLGMPTGILNKTAATVKFDSIEGGGEAAAVFTFIVTRDAEYGYNPFTLEASYTSAPNQGSEKVSQYFGVTVSSSDLRIESVTLPGSVSINADFEVEVAVENTGADTTDVILTLLPQGGLIHKSSNTVKIDEIKSGETVIRTFVFMALESSPDGYAPINITLSHGADQITQYSGTIVKNPPKKTENEPAPKDKGDIPVVIISRFTYGNKSGDALAVYGGQTFDFTLELSNTHKTVAVKDLKITFSQEHGIFNPKSGSNTFFVEWLGPGQSAEISIPLLVKSDADPDSYGLTVSLSYKNEKGEATSGSEIINIPVQQEMRFSVGDLPPINDTEMGDEAYVNVQFGNLGKSWIYNVAVRVQGDGFSNMEGTYYAGNIEKGKFLSKEFILTPYDPGYLSGSFVFSYEDADGNIYEQETPFSFMVIGGEIWDPGSNGEDILLGPDGQPITGEGEGEEKEGGFWLFTDMNPIKWAIIIGGGAVFAAVIVAVIALSVRAKRKKEENDGDEGL